MPATIIQTNSRPFNKVQVARLDLENLRPVFGAFEQLGERHQGSLV